MKGFKSSMRTVKWYVRYRPGSRTIIRLEYRTKAEALKAQIAGEVVFQVKGHYFPGMVKKLRRRRSAVTQSSDLQG